MKLERIIAVRTSKTVYRDGELCIKVFGDDYAKSRILAEAATHAKIEETGLDVPKILEVIKTEGKWAIVSEFIAGKTIERLMDEEPERRAEYMSRFVDAQLRINSTKARGLAKLKERIEESLFEAGLSSATLYDLHMKLESLPQGDKVCHGDFAPSNLIACGDGRDCAVDWSRAAQGSPEADAARTYLLFWLNGEIDGAEEYLELYCAKSGLPKSAVQAWIPLRAAERLAAGRAEEAEFLRHWTNVADYE